MIEKLKIYFFRTYIIYVAILYILMAYMLISEQSEFNERQRMINAERNMYFHVA